MKTIVFILFAAVCLIIGVYPLLYLLNDGRFGILQTKSESVVSDAKWQMAFYAHIVCGGVALSVGWLQFVTSWRVRCVKCHRTVGQLYILMVGVSGLAAVCLSPMTSTGWVAGLGFCSLSVVWLYVTLEACRSIRQRDLLNHRNMMVYSYSACCAAVTLRLWLPLMIGVLHLDFAIAYPVVAWLCWVPNLLVARWINLRTLKNRMDSDEVLR